MSEDAFQRAALLLAHDGPQAQDAVVPPIVQTSLFTFSSHAEMAATFRGEITRPVYSRGLNPTVRRFEEMMAALEWGEDAIGFASGMAAISATLLALVRPGDRIVCVRHVYPDAYRLFRTLLAGLDIAVTFVDGRDAGAVAAALPGASLLYLESPTSWVMEVQDVRALAALARAAGAISVIDNSWATPLFQQPLRLGADLVLHSASKYIGGHSDVVAGVVVGSGDLIGRIRAGTVPYLGSRLSPFEAWLLIRGLRTLPLRLRAHETTALDLARRLAAHPGVAGVHHPGLHPLPPGLTGTSGLFSVRLREGLDIPAFTDALRLFRLGVSWGGHESLVMPADIALAQVAGPNAPADFGVSPLVVRLHAGLEGVEALWSDLAAALAAAGG